MDTIRAAGLAACALGISFYSDAHAATKAAEGQGTGCSALRARNAIVGTHDRFRHSTGSSRWRHRRHDAGYQLQGGVPKARSGPQLVAGSTISKISRGAQ